MGIHLYIVTDPKGVEGFRIALAQTLLTGENVNVIAVPETSEHHTDHVDLGLQRFFTFWVQSVDPQPDELLVIAQDQATNEWVRITSKQDQIMIEVMR